MKLKTSKTNRGFSLVEFKDSNGEDCSLQKSSRADVDSIWLGIDNANPQIMCYDARQLGLRPIYGDERDNGWCDYKVPEQVLMSTRMHLTQEQVKKLIPILQKFVDTGEIR